MRGRNTNLHGFRLAPEVVKLLDEVAAETQLSRNDIVNLAIVYFFNSPIPDIIPLLFHATRRRRRNIKYINVET